MADPNPPSPPENRDEDMDISDATATSDDDDDDFSFAEESLPEMEIPDMIPLARVVGPHRVLSHNQLRMAGLLFNDRSTFVQHYQVLSVGLLENRAHQHLENGGKVMLPPSALQQLYRNSTANMGPMLFKATNRMNQKFTHCGVLEFIAEEHLCYMPSWMMEILGATDHTMIQIERAELPVATFAKFQPQSVDFLEISNPKAILEKTLRLLACLTKGDMIAFTYNDKVYKLCVLELLPADAVNIIECDMNVDFAAPVGYVSPSAKEEDELEDTTGTAPIVVNGFVPFLGSGNRLNGKEAEASPSTTQRTKLLAKHAPDFEWKIGTLQYKRRFKKHSEDATTGADKKFSAFGGTGLSLKTTKKPVPK
ncbi:Ubiquitin fusion degradation protein 1 [Orchesella cincta]|uniref:Ubiquitin fusion degradation protein 1 n=1 Tax=Orchesella cincta TaxID=48709 RepID=A0A1D2MHU5_ORCCI|nr:Ubiquitin fusion degradation protein 1 [Orchesella cincta]